MLTMSVAQSFALHVPRASFAERRPLTEADLKVVSRRQPTAQEAALAQQVNLSESACLRRVRRLTEIGLIRGYVGLVDQSSAGYPDNVFVRITLTSQQQDDLKNFETAVRKIPEVMECYLMSGDADYLVRVIVADSRDYERVHSQHLTRLPGVDRVAPRRLRPVEN